MNEMKLISLAFVAATIIIAFLLIIALLLIKKGNRKASFFLIFLILIYASSSFSSLLMFSGGYKYIPTIVLAYVPFAFIPGVIYYSYIRLLLNIKLKLYHLIHFIPALYGLYQVKWFFFLPNEKKVQLLTEIWFGGYKINILEFLMYSIPNFITITYLLISLWLILKTIQKLKSNFSNTDIEYLNWLKKFTLIYLFLILVDVIRLGLTTKYGWDPAKGEVVTNLLISVLIQYYIIQTIKNPDRVFYILSEPKKPTITLPIKETNNEEIVKVDSDFSKILSTFMKEEKPYLNPELKSHELAMMLQVTPHHLSKTINQEFNVNFYNFINQYRVNEFIEKALNNENKNLTLAAIAQTVGFNSKSSFNRIFKNIKLVTPREYLKQYNVKS